MANKFRDPKTGRFVKNQDKERREILETPHHEMDELFDDLPTPPQDADDDIMASFIIGILLSALCGLALALLL